MRKCAWQVQHWLHTHLPHFSAVCGAPAHNGGQVRQTIGQPRRAAQPLEHSRQHGWGRSAGAALAAMPFACCGLHRELHAAPQYDVEYWTALVRCEAARTAAPLDADAEWQPFTPAQREHAAWQCRIARQHYLAEQMNAAHARRAVVVNGEHVRSGGSWCIAPTGLNRAGGGGVCGVCGV